MSLGKGCPMTPRMTTRSGFGPRVTHSADLAAAALAGVLAPRPLLAAGCALLVLRAGGERRSGEGIADLAALLPRVAVLVSLLGVAGADVRPWALALGCSAACAATLRVVVIRRRRRRDYGAGLSEPTVVVGEDRDVMEHVRQFAVHPGLGVRPVATVGPADEPPTMLPHAPMHHLAAVVQRHGAMHVLVASPGLAQELGAEMAAVRRSGCRVTVVAPMAEQLTSSAELVDVRGLPMVSLPPRPGQRATSLWPKRAVDITGAVAGLIALGPLVALAALAVRLHDGGPALFRQQRVGRNGRLFTMFKLRSMVIDAEERRARLEDENEASGPFFKIEDDPRVTRLGRFLRRYSIDELPQLYNVLRGDMSLVGPRPCLPEEVAKCPELLSRRQDTTPGITGLWQVAGCSWLPMEEGLRMDAAYVEGWSLSLDARILARTFTVALRNERRPPIEARTEVGGLDRTRYVGAVDGDDLRPGAPVDLSIVVVTHEAERDIAECLDALSESCNGVRHELLVVDNMSRDRTVEIVQQSAPGARILRKRRRDGFATNANTGIVASSGRHVLVLNPDARPRPGSLSELVDHLESHPDVGAVGPALVYPDGRPQASARQFPTLVNGFVRRTPLRRLLPGRAEAHLLDVPDGQPVRDVDWLLGGAVALRREALDHIGGFDDAYRLYCEDMDLCWRLHEVGWRVQQRCSTVMEHDLAELTTRRFLTRRTVWHLRSAVRFVRLHGLGRPTVRRSVPDVHVPPFGEVIDLTGELPTEFAY